MEDVFAQTVQVDQILPVDHVAGGEDPPGVAHVSQLVWSPIKATLNRLPLAQPHAQLVSVDVFYVAQDLERADRCKDIRCVTLRHGDCPEGSIDILAAQNVISDSFSVNLVESV